MTNHKYAYLQVLQVCQSRENIFWQIMNTISCYVSAERMQKAGDTWQKILNVWKECPP